MPQFLHLVAFNLGDSAKKGIDPRIVGVPVTGELARTKYLLETRKREAFVHWMIINRRAALANHKGSAPMAIP
jgi:hypothetical protein